MFRPFGPDQLAHVQRLRSAVRRVPPGTELMRHDVGDAPLMTIYAGWAFTHTTGDHGGRQILEFHLPGDLVGAEHLAVKSADTLVEALTAVSACVFPRARVLAEMKGNPGLSASIAWLLARDEAMLHERMVSLGRRSAEERLAHLALELATRIRLRRRINADGPLPFPPTHRHLADALGLSAEAVSRAAARLRAHGLAQMARGVLLISDAERLAALCGWHADYMIPREML
jgi:CRP/FNR family transcriptional regulator